MGRTGKLIHQINWVKYIVLLLLAGLLAVITITVVKEFSQSETDVSFYQLISSKVTSNVRIVMLSDLHLKEFDSGNSKLIQQITDLKPNIITMVGDMDTRKTSDNSVIISLCRELLKVAPIYYSYGNHEYDDILFCEDYSLTSSLKDLGVVIVNNDFVSVEVNKNKFDIGGFCANKDTFYDNASSFMEKYEAESTGFKLLLSHFPNVFEENSVMADFPVDLALSGHEHGGQVRLPFIGAIYTPDQGFFPKLVQGKHSACGSTLIISRGLGSSNSLPRFNNNPEIVVVDIDWR